MKLKKKFLNSVKWTGTFAMNVRMEMMKMCFLYVMSVNFTVAMFTVIKVCIIFSLKETGIAKNVDKCYKSVKRQQKR